MGLSPMRSSSNYLSRTGVQVKLTLIFAGTEKQGNESVLGVKRQVCKDNHEKDRSNVVNLSLTAIDNKIITPGS